MKRRNYIWNRLTPYQLLILGYAFVTVTGAILLSLPVSSAQGTPQPFLDALFVATSGISTSGLSAVDIGTYYSLFGQIVLLAIFQLGGIGYMSFIILTMYVLGIKGSLRTSLVAKESLAGPNLHVLKGFFLSVLVYSFVFELVGAAILAGFWMKEYSAARSMYLGVFHSVSTFCTAGFGLFPDSLMRYRDSTLLNATIVFLSLAGGIGFFVLRDLTAFVTNKLNGRRRSRLTVHTRLVLIVTAIVISIGTIVILFSEHWPSTMSCLRQDADLRISGGLGLDDGRIQHDRYRQNGRGEPDDYHAPDVRRGFTREHRRRHQDDHIRSPLHSGPSATAEETNRTRWGRRCPSGASMTRPS